MNSKRCAVTGARGYLGSRLVQHFRGRGWNVVEMSREVLRSEFTIPYSLTSDINARDLAGVDALIHCAHDFGARSGATMRRVNIDGSVRLFRAATEAKVGIVIFISSMAAFDGCKSLYGRAKIEIEREAAQREAYIVRPGTIYGSQAGGLVSALRKVAGKLPVVPVIGHGKYLVYLTHETDLCELLFALCEKRLTVTAPGPINAAARNATTFYQLLKALAAAEGRKPLFVPVSWRLVFAGLKLLEAFGLRPGLRSDSVLSLVNYNANPDFSATEQTGLHFREFSSKDL